MAFELTDRHREILNVMKDSPCTWEDLRKTISVQIVDIFPGTPSTDLFVELIELEKAGYIVTGESDEGAAKPIRFYALTEKGRAVVFT